MSERVEHHIKNTEYSDREWVETWCGERIQVCGSMSRNEGDYRPPECEKCRRKMDEAGVGEAQ